MYGLGRALGPICFVGSLCAATFAHAEQQFGTMEGIAFFYPDDFACGERVAVNLRAESSASFSDPEFMKRVAPQVAASLEWDCAEAENIKMDGFVGDELVYSAITAKASAWAVMVRMAPEPGQTASNASTTSTGGTLPTLPTTGENQAEAQSADAEATGSGNDAMDRLRSIGGQNAKPQNEEPTEDFNSAGYNQAQMLDAFYNGDFELLEGSSAPYFYINGFNRFFGSTINFIDQRCAYLFKPELDKNTLKVMYGKITGGGSVEEQGFQILKDMADMLGDLQTGGVDVLIDRAGGIDVLQQGGEKDAARLADTLKCQDPIIKRVYDNMEAFVNGMPPKMSPTVLRRKKVEIAQANIAASCEDRFGNRKFCGCLIEGMRNIDISVEAWEGAGSDLANLAFIAADPMVGRELVRSCQ